MTSTWVEIVNRIQNDYEENYIVYWEDGEGYAHFSEDYYLTGRDAIKLYEEKVKDCHCKYVELQYDPVDDDEDTDRIVLVSNMKREIDIFGIKMYV